MFPNAFSAPMPEIDISGKTILIIEDYHAMRSVFRDIMRSCGADVRKITMVANGSEAIASLNRGQYDVVLCDFNLGSGRNGQQVLAEARIRGLIALDCIWIMVSADKTADTVMGAAEHQPDAYLLKPIAEATLSLRLARIIKKKHAFEEIHQAMEQLDYPKAISLCDTRMVTDKAHAADLLRIKCGLLLSSGELGRAKELLEKILLERDFPWAKVCLAKVLIKNKTFEAAKTLLEETVAISPSFLEARDLLAETLQTMNDLEGANSVLEQAVKLSPNSVTRQKILGEVSIKMGRLEEAERAFQKCVSLGENSILKSEGMIYHESGNNEKAKLIAEELGECFGKDDVDHDSERSLEMARLFMATGNTKNAITLLRREVKNNPENAAFLDEVNEIFVAAEMGEEGAKLVEVSRQEAMEMMNRGVLLVSKGEYKEAIDAMRNAREVMPTNFRVLLNLAYALTCNSPWSCRGEHSSLCF